MGREEEEREGKHAKNEADEKTGAALAFVIGSAKERGNDVFWGNEAEIEIADASSHRESRAGKVDFFSSELASVIKIKMAVLNLNLCLPPKHPVSGVASCVSSPLHTLVMPRAPRLPRVASPLPLTVRASFDTASATVGQVTEVTKDTFWPIVRSAGDKTVVLDMYTQWCGPCKVMAPKYQELSEKYLDVVFLKLDCNQENKPLAKELGIRVVPTFKILKDSKVVKEVTGAKFDDLVFAIESVRSS
ncbi:thioredoxin F-type, chloroplastic [Neltuma alba]|uniref:thioredoxin F-type, chloroplastic n=1 Tax=Neltuma alba TaxID=207710 RepID=UPI0010A3ED7F|nr:thioredoxin F-type, chloroplastic-like [Prosopis alba]